MRNGWLDVCRATAIGLVLLGHARLFVRDAYPAAELLKAGSFVGVELFFVLSGFLIGGLLLDAASGGQAGWLRNFYARRWWRTLPNYYLFLLVNVLLVMGAIRPGDLAGLAPYVVFAQSLAWPHPVFFGEAWSLAIEEVFYLTFPLAFLLVARAVAVTPARALVGVALVVVVASPVLRWWLVPAAGSWDELARKPVLLRLDAIMYGVLLAWLWTHRRRRIGPVSVALALTFLAGSSLYVALTPDAALNGSVFAKSLLFSVTSVGCCGLLWCGLDARLAPGPRALFGFLARISYSAYLANIPVALLLFAAWPFDGDGAVKQVLRGSLFLALTIMVSWAIHRWYEAPFLRLRERLAPRGKAVGAA